MEDNERLIEQFLKQNRQEIADDGFTERVMRGLPERKPQYDWLPTIWNAVMMTLALVLFIIFGGVGLVKDALYQNLDLALTQGVDMRVIFALMCTFVFYISQKAIQKA
jgi:hypothetical protein